MAASANDSLDFARLLPESVNGWRQQGSDEIYNRDNLYEFIDGGAELYLSYGFQKLLHRNFTRPDFPDIIADIFDMGSSANAFGVFMHSRGKADSAFGQGSEYIQGFLNFWKGKYYVTILTMEETPESKQAVFKLGKFIDSRIKQRGSLPQLIKLLPDKGLKESSIRYFHHYIWINSQIRLSDENILKIDDKTEVAAAKYDEGSTLLIVHYPDAQKAKKVWQNLKENIFPDLKKSAIIKHGDKWLFIKPENTYLVLIGNASPEPLSELMKAVLQNIRQKQTR